jgi:hypothetical protein
MDNTNRIRQSQVLSQKLKKLKLNMELSRIFFKNLGTASFRDPEDWLNWWEGLPLLQIAFLLTVTPPAGLIGRSFPWRNLESCTLTIRCGM